jgi:hypothetical protein
MNNSLLDAGSGAVVEPDHRDPDRRGQIHDLVDLLGEDLTQCPAEDGEVLAEDAHPPTFDGAETGDHPVGVGPVLLEAHAVGTMAGQHVELLEGVVIEQVVNALTSGHLPLGVVLLHRPGGTGIAGLLAAFRQFLEPLGHRMIHGQRGYRTGARTLALWRLAGPAHRPIQGGVFTQCGPHHT